MQTSQSNISTSDIAHRFGYHKANLTTGPLHDEVRVSFKDFAEYLNRKCPVGRAKSLAFTKLEEVSMWAHKAIAEMAPLVEPELPIEVPAHLVEKVKENNPKGTRFG